jgi:cysteinyl-tRNA synthetase
MDKLNVQPIEIVCKATDFIKEMIEFIKKIEKNGYTYNTHDGVYFDTSKLTDYGKLESRKKKIKTLKKEARIKSNIEKRNISDFALWKFSTKNQKRQMKWTSPWGTGFPGWHIECSVMSNKFLGEQFDIHTGGIDHIPIHHTNEIAQSKAASGKEPAKYWLHNEFVMVEGEKMAKSEHNYITMKEIENKGVDPLALRYLFLTAHYRSKINFTWKSLATAEKTLSTLRENILRLLEPDKTKTDKTRVKFYEKEFLKAINDDLNTTNAVKVLWKLLRKEKKIKNKDKYKLILEIDKILGLNLKEVQEEKIKLSTSAKKLIIEREKARNKKYFETADNIRKQLREEFDIILIDTPEGPRWKKAEH